MPGNGDDCLLAIVELRPEKVVDQESKAQES